MGCIYTHGPVLRRCSEGGSEARLPQHHNHIHSRRRPRPSWLRQHRFLVPPLVPRSSSRPQLLHQLIPVRLFKKQRKARASDLGTCGSRPLFIPAPCPATLGHLSHRCAAPRELGSLSFMPPKTSVPEPALVSMKQYMKSGFKERKEGTPAGKEKGKERREGGRKEEEKPILRQQQHSETTGLPLRKQTRPPCKHRLSSPETQEPSRSTGSA